MNSKDQQLLEEAYEDTQKFVTSQNPKKYKSYFNLETKFQSLLKNIASEFQISNLDAYKWEREAMAAALQEGIKIGIEVGRASSNR